MATITVPTQKLLIPFDGFSFHTFGSASNSITGSNGGVAWLYTPQENHNITQIIFQYTINTTPSPNTFDVGIQGINATTGKPDGTFVSSGTWTAPSSGNGFATVNITSYAVTKGTDYYIVIRNATSGYSGSVSIAATANNVTLNRGNGAYQRTSGVWSAPTTRPGGNYWLYSGTKYYGNNCYSLSGSEATVTGSNEIGTTFILPANMPTLKLSAVLLYTVTINAGSLYDIILKDSSGTTLSTVTLDGDQVNTYTYAMFPTSISITPGSKYYVMMKQNTGTTPRLRTCVNPSAQIMTDIRNGIVANKVTFNGTTYTETTTVTCQGFLLFDEISYDQTGGSTIYSLPAGFNSFSG